MSKMVEQKDGFLEGKDGWSSKRLLSVLGWATALLISAAGLAFKLDGQTVQGLVITFLTFAGAMQGVSVWQEKK